MTTLLNLPCIGLFGTCGNSTWRNSFINEYQKIGGIRYYNPQVADWKPEDAAIEAEHLINDDIVLFPVTSETYGIGSLAETGYSIMSAIRADAKRYVVLFIDPKVDQQLIDDNAGAAKESTRSRALVLAHLRKVNHPNVFFVSSLEEMLELSIKLYGVVYTMQQIRDKHKLR